jgi:hypothetical protein
VEDFVDARVARNQNILEFIGDYDENDASLPVLEEILLHVENN